VNSLSSSFSFVSQLRTGSSAVECFKQEIGRLRRHSALAILLCSRGPSASRREDQIIGVLNEAEVGAKTEDLCRKYGISEPTFYNWKGEYAGMMVSDAGRLRELEAENSKLKKLLAETELDKAREDLLNRKW
jgi:putative transposase